MKMDPDDKVKTGCMGILLPLAAALYGIHKIVHPRQFSRFTGFYYEGERVVGFGIGALGLAVFCHGLGFVPYSRIPLLKYLVAALGVALFVLGLLWDHIQD